MKIAKFIMPLVLAAGTASASETILDVAGGARMLYGYSDVATRYEPLDQNNHYPASGFVYLSAEQDFDNGYSAAVYLDLMAASDKEIQNFNNPEQKDLTNIIYKNEQENPETKVNTTTPAENSEVAPAVDNTSENPVAQL